MLEKIKKSFRSASSKNGSYSVGMIALVICMVIVVNLIAGQLPESVKSIDISDNNIYGVSKTSKKVLNKLDKKVTFKIYAEKIRQIQGSNHSSRNIRHCLISLV